MGKDQSLKLPFPIVLASTSKYRGALLSQLGWAFTQEAPGVDEDALKASGKSPSDLALVLSRMKAEAVFKRHPRACVIGSDQVCTLEGKILSKPGTPERALEQLQFLQGKTHELMTAVTVLSPGGSHSFVNVTKLSMRALSRSELETYLEADRPFDCAGSYKLESRGIKLFERLSMTDHTAIIGLPLIELTNQLLNLGYPV